MSETMGGEEVGTKHQGMCESSAVTRMSVTIWVTARLNQELWKQVKGVLGVSSVTYTAAPRHQVIVFDGTLSDAHCVLSNTASEHE